MARRGRKPATEKPVLATTVRYLADRMELLTGRGYTHSEAYALGVEALIQITNDSEVDIQACRKEERAADQLLQQALARKAVLLASRHKMEIEALDRAREAARHPERLDPKEQMKGAREAIKREK